MRPAAWFHVGDTVAVVGPSEFEGEAGRVVRTGPGAVVTVRFIELHGSHDRRLPCELLAACCPDCGAPGESRGHHTCAYPFDAAPVMRREL